MYLSFKLVFQYSILRCLFISRYNLDVQKEKKFQSEVGKFVLEEKIIDTVYQGTGSLMKCFDLRFF